MKSLNTILAFVFLMLMPLILKAQEPEVTLEFQNASRAMEVVQNYVKALQAGDVSTMDAQLSDNVMVYGLGGGLDSLTRAQHKEYYTNSTNRFNHNLSRELYLPVKVTNNWNEGEWILAWGTNTLNGKENNATIQVPYHIAALIVNGKISRLHYWYDMLNVMKKQGFEVVPPSK